ncbi:lysosomal thioesterase PPT2a.1 precursor [Danio rerio]|uniref:palmitoyl-CoA hydrolase n=1 Tax=Danio rerio TaxID=7955 RepID=F1RD68_DANRE|nr:lysosomal thioesterase PPT2a.1 precursor [Danio rerio]|eukprot:NP_956978.2 zgc:66024 precursor [Danio rerio]
MTDSSRPCVFIWAVLLLLPTVIMAYRPVILVHGLFGGPEQMEMLKKYIKRSHPGTSVTAISLYDDNASSKPMWEQVDGFREAIRPIMDRAKDGVHLICYSQGGLICRGVLATLPHHNVHSVIFLSSPLAGQYGDSNYISKFFPSFVKSTLYNACYTTRGQQISSCSYWKDPHQIEKYLKYSVFLAPLNGEVETVHTQAWRKNFLRIKTMVLLGGPDDGTIKPWQSSMFGFYNRNEKVIDMEHQDYYISDSFGLKTLNRRKAIVKCIIPDVHHDAWPTDYKIYKKCIEKWLT